MKPRKSYWWLAYLVLFMVVGIITYLCIAQPTSGSFFPEMRLQALEQSDDSRLKTLKEYGFYYYEPQAGLCFRAVLFYQAVSETQVACDRRVRNLLVNKSEYPKL